MIEQWFFGLSQAFGDVKRLFDNLVSLFENQDKAVVFLVTIFGFLWLMTTYLLIIGGKWQLIVVIFFGLIFISEIHHLLRALVAMAYYPGTVTGFLMFILGLVLVKESLQVLESR